MTNLYHLPTDEKIDIRLLERMLEEGLVNSYKLFWFSGIFKELLEGNTVLSFRRIVCRMIVAAWYPLAEFHLNFGPLDKLYELVQLIKGKYNLSNNIKEVELLEFLRTTTDKEINKRIKNLFNFVPFRLISPFLVEEDKVGPDHERNRIIAEMSNVRKGVFYRIDREHGYIEVNEEWYDYIIRNQNIIYGWMNFKLVTFLQRRNPNVPGIPFKLEAPRERNLNPAKKFWVSACKTIEVADIYSGDAFSGDGINRINEISIDHFIPWSFVLHDELWNLTPTFKGINSAKSDRLPDLGKYFDSFCELQYQTVAVMAEKREFKKQLEDYLTIDRKIEIGSILNGNGKQEFIQSLKATIQPLHQIAYNQGYEIWRYKNN